MPKPPRSLRRSGQILKAGSGQLRSIYDETRRLKAMHRRVTQYVHGDIDVASFKDGDLHLIATSAASATRIRYRQKVLISELNREQGPTIHSITVSVRPMTGNPLREPATARNTESAGERAYLKPTEDNQRNQSATRPAREISRQSAEHLAETASYIEDEHLRKALERLSKRGK
ncbi:MAG: DciA family protein [Pseudomonadota bacterium]